MISRGMACAERAVGMRITGVRIWRAELAYREPFRTALGESARAQVLVVELATDEGLRGLGECAPLPKVTGETLGDALMALKALGRELVGSDPLRREVLRELALKLAPRCPAARAAVDMALWDLVGQLAGRPLHQLLGGFRDRVRTDITISLKEPEEMAEDALKAVEAGFRALKLKVGEGGVEKDVERVRAVRDAVGLTVELCVDANQAWSVQEALKAVRELGRLEVAFVEQPVPAEDLPGLARVRWASPVPVMADEAVLGPGDALKAIQAEAVDLINVKLMKCGGISEALRLAAIAEAAGVGLMVGCGGESRLAITAGTHLAAALKVFQHADLDSDLLLAEDIVAKGGSSVERGERLLPSGPGLGVEELRKERMELVARLGPD